MSDPKHDENAATKSNTLSRRLGWQAAVTIVLTALVTLAVVGFLGFLWFADLSNSTWHRIMVTGWATRAVSISTLVLRSAIDLQAGVAAAMLAAIILESTSVQLRNAAKVSTMRASSPQPRALLELIPAMSGVECTWFRLDFLGRCYATIQHSSAQLEIVPYRLIIFLQVLAVLFFFCFLRLPYSNSAPLGFCPIFT